MDLIEEQPHDVSIWEQVALDQPLCDGCHDHRAVVSLGMGRVCGSCWLTSRLAA